MRRCARLDAAALVALLWAVPGRGQQVRAAGGRPAADSVAARAAADSAQRRVIQTGYGRRPADEVTGAVTQVEAPDFNGGRVVSLEQLIQDRIAGVQVLDDNEPGGSLSIRIRNPASLPGADPLYVVDGVPIRPALLGGAAAGRDALEFLDPDDIASITVLRDGAAAAICGMDAANGVVLITTRSAQGSPRLEYRGSASASSVTRLPDVLSAAQFRDVVAGTAPLTAVPLGDANTDWTRMVSQIAHGQAHHVALSGSGPAGVYRLSAGYLRQNGVLRATTAERLSLGLRDDARLFGDHLDLHLVANGARLYDRAPPAGILTAAALMAPTQPVYDSTSASGYYSWPWPTAPRNPVEELQQTPSTGTTYRGVAQVLAGLHLPFAPGLRAQVRVAYDGAGGDQDAVSNGIGAVLRVHGTPHHTGTDLEAQLTYSTAQLPVSGRWDFLAGYERSRSHSQYRATTVTEPGAVAAWTSEIDQDDTLRSFFGRVQYALADRYSASVSVRRDRSSRFGPGSQWGTFPSAAVAWHVSREPFAKRMFAGNDLTLRASWARTGSQSAATAFADPSSPVPVDPDIRWERTTSWDAGLDFGLFGERVSGSIDLYTRRTGDLIYTVPVAASAGPTSWLVTNIGTVRNQGVEASVSARVLQPRGHGLAWKVVFTASRNANQVLDLRVPAFTSWASGGVGTSIAPGQPLNTFLLYRQAYDGAGRPIQSAFVDVNGDFIVNGSDLRPYGTPAPQKIFGLASDLTWGAFDLSFTLRAYVGNRIYDDAAARYGTYDLLTGVVPYNMNASVLRTNFTTPEIASDYYLEDASFLRMDAIGFGWTLRRRPDEIRLFATVQNVFTITGYRGMDPAAVPSGIDDYVYPPARTLVAGLDVRL